MLLLILILLLLIGAGVLGVLRARLIGAVSLAQFDGSVVTVPLPARPWLLLPAYPLIGVNGRMLIVGIPFTRRMHIWIVCPGRPAGDGTLRPDASRYISGIWVVHDASARPEAIGGDDRPWPETAQAGLVLVGPGMRPSRMRNPPHTVTTQRERTRVIAISPTFSA